MTTTTRAPSPDAQQTIRAAAALMAKCNALWQDEQYVDQGWRVDYAVDTDVLKLFMAPEQMSKYAQVFDEDENSETTQLLAGILGEYILHDLPGSRARDGDKQGHLFIISPHDEELERMTSALASKVLVKTEKAKELIRTIVDKLTDSNQQDKEAFLRDVVANAKDLIDAFDGEAGPRRELSRLSLLGEKRVLNISRFQPYQTSTHGDTILPPRGDIPSPERDEFVALVGSWRVLLTKHMAWRKPQYALSRDAFVMATLEWVNRRQILNKRRLVLITGSEYLVNAAQEVLIRSEGSFAQCYLRHPLSFVATKSFFEHSAKNKQGSKHYSDTPPFRLSDWLNLFFPAALKKIAKFGVQVDTKVLIKIASGNNKELNTAVAILASNESKSQGVAQFPDDLLENWANAIAITATLRGFTPTLKHWKDRVQEFVAQVENKLSLGWKVSDFQRELDKLAYRSLSDLYLSTSKLGTLSDVKVNVRGLPALRFDKPYRQAETICAKLVNGMFNGRNSSIDSLYSDLRLMDASNYHAHVIHALVFAGQGHWFATRTLCRIALRVVDDLPDSGRNYRTGREAAYLLAVTDRRLARNETELLATRERMIDVRKRENPSLAGQSAQDDVRFDSEDFAREALTEQFLFFSSKNTDSSKPFQDYLSRAEEIVANAMAQHKVDKLGDVKNWVIRQTVTNSLILALLQVSRGRIRSNSVVIHRRLLALIEFLPTNGLAPPSAPGQAAFRDSLSDFVYWVAVFVFTSNTRLRNVASAHVNTTKSLGPSLLPFEKERLSLFKNLESIVKPIR